MEHQMANQIVEHWKAVLPTGMNVEHQPYDHSYLEGFFPKEVYDQMLERFPSSENYQPLNTKRYVRAGGESTRDIMTLNADGVAHLDNSLREFWGQIGEALSCDALKRMVFDVMKRDIALRLGINESEVVDTKAYISLLLIRDTEQYFIKPHTDGFPRLVTMMLYLPNDMSQEDLGTSVYVEEPFYKRIIGKKFREIKRFPFRPNSAAAFAVNNLSQRRSWHGRELIGPGRGARNVIAVAWLSEPPSGEKSEKLQVEAVHDRIS